MRKTKLRISGRLLLIILAVSLAGCGGTPKLKKKKADDSISKAIYESAGKKVSYEGREINRRYVLEYEYIIPNDEDINVLADMVEAANEVLEEEDKGAVVLRILERLPGGWTVTVSASNYDVTESVSYRDSLYYMTIMGNDVLDDYSLYNRASFYPSIEGIEYLRVIGNVNEDAEEEGIDWYEVFPDLKGYEVYAGRVNGKYSDEIIYQEMKEDEGNKVSGETDEESLLNSNRRSLYTNF